MEIRYGQETMAGRAEQMREYRARRAIDAGREPGRIGRPPTAVHGTNTKYLAGCRCGECKVAHADAARQYRQRRSSSHSG